MDTARVLVVFIVFIVFGLAACDVGEVPPRIVDAPDAGLAGAGPHDQLTSCPSWTSVQLHPTFCERACEPRPTQLGSQCAGATNPTVTDTQTCSPATQVNGVLGCCAMAVNPYRVLFYECPR